MKLFGLIIATVILTFTSCAKIGNEFSSTYVKAIQIGETTQDEIVNMFGQPWRIGLEDGIKIWTYGRYTGNSRDRSLDVPSCRGCCSRSYCRREPQGNFHGPLFFRRLSRCFCCPAGTRANR